jgi:hypothetical protein
MTTNGLAIRSMDDVERIATIAVASNYTACRRVEEAAMIIITGHELGLSPAQSLRGIYVVKGKPVLAADTMVAVVRRSGLCESWRTVESTPERCTITTRRKGETHDAERTWTIADAKRAGLLTNGTWGAYPAAMLRHRCASDLAREVYPDVILGMYDPEEMESALTAEDVREDHIAAARSEVSRRMAAGQSAESIEGQLRNIIGRPQAIPTLASIGIEVQRPTLPAPSSWPADLAACTTLADVRAAYAASVTPDTSSAMRDDVRAWLAERGIPGVTGAEATALLSTLPEDACRVLSELWLDEEREASERCVTAARAVKGAAWDAHSTKTAHTVVVRCYAHTTGADSLRGAADALVAARDAVEEAHALEVPADVQERIASKTTRPALLNSIRAHAAEVLANPTLAGLYAAQWVKVNAAPNDPRPLPDQYDDALARVRDVATKATEGSAE